MLAYIKYLIQLLLAPSRGWQDVASSRPSPETLLRRGFYPLLALTAVMEFCGLFYNKGLSWDVFIIRAVIDFGAYFVALYIARVIFELYLKPMVPSAEPEEVRRRGVVLILLALGEMLLVQIICNALQADITILKFLPLYVVLILYKGASFIGVKADAVMGFTLLAAGATVVVPELISYLLSLILL